ncbi:unnamed protein product [Heterobilharzia americana]|nr:unnamed protein product [Heterobilharzia americana]
MKLIYGLKIDIHRMINGNPVNIMLTGAKHQIPSHNYPYSTTSHQHIYENASTFPIPQICTTTTPSTIASSYSLNTFTTDSHHQPQLNQYPTVSTFEHFYPKEVVRDHIYAYPHQQQRSRSQHLPPPNINVSLPSFLNESPAPYINKQIGTIYQTSKSNEKQDCLLNNTSNICDTLLLNNDTNLSQWDVNDPKLPKIRHFDTFTMWPQGHCRYAYKKSQSEGARRHASGWAMRNTNNHNSQILKKSCLGVLLCTSKQCTLAMRPAICDKARKRQEGRPCCMPSCNGCIYIQSCHGHGGYPVTHFWREHGDTIYFQAKGTHDHIRPDLKPVRDTAARRRKQQAQQLQGCIQEQQQSQKVSRRSNMKNVKSFEITDVQSQQYDKKSIPLLKDFNYLNNHYQYHLIQWVIIQVHVNFCKQILKEELLNTVSRI